MWRGSEVLQIRRDRSLDLAWRERLTKVFQRPLPRWQHLRVVGVGKANEVKFSRPLGAHANSKVRMQPTSETFGAQEGRVSYAISFWLWRISSALPVCNFCQLKVCVLVGCLFSAHGKCKALLPKRCNFCSHPCVIALNFLNSILCFHQIRS